MHHAVRIVVAVVLLWLPFVPMAQAPTVELKEAWIRGTVQGQNVTGAFMDITSRVPARLVGVAAPSAGMAEIHSMRMEGGVMHMHPVEGIELPANKTVKLAPGGYHVMLAGLKRPLKAGEKLPLRLTFEFAGGKRETIELQVEVRAVTGAKSHAH